MIIFSIPLLSVSSNCPKSVSGFNMLSLVYSQMEEYQGMLENSGLVGYAQEVLKETDQSCFVQTAKQLHVRYIFKTL